MRYGSYAKQHKKSTIKKGYKGKSRGKSSHTSQCGIEYIYIIDKLAYKSSLDEEGNLCAITF